jgi:CRISPR-associated protein Cas2
MLVWAVYDISETKIRNKIIKICQKHGLIRVQKSVFLGNINETQLKSAVSQTESLIDKETDSVYIFPFCQEDFKKIQLLGLAFDKAMINDELRELFL